MRDAELQVTSTEDKRMELDIREILIQMNIPPEKWPTDLLQP